MSSPVEISLYFHSPFCTRKCDYCHFYVLPESEEAKDQLLDAFSLEWDFRLPYLRDKSIKTIYFGGGTPSLFAPSRLQAVLQWIKQTVPFCCTDPEITLEANPENITLQLIQEYAQAGVNRVSLGIQTLDDQLLKLLGRQHSAETAIQAVHTIRAAGIRNLSIDLMYDLPKQTLLHWTKTLAVVCDLPITHLSLYNLTIEPHTIFFKKQATLRPQLPDEETSLLMYQTAIDALEKRGLSQYEISAFAEAGYQSKHNVGYWTARPFMGFGPSAFSYWQGQRFRNVPHLRRYHEALRSGASPVDFQEQLEEEAQRRELLVIQLRLREGLILADFEQKQGKLSQETKRAVAKLVEEGFLEWNASSVRLTNKGVLFYDSLAAELI